MPAVGDLAHFPLEPSRPKDTEQVVDQKLVERDAYVLDVDATANAPEPLAVRLEPHVLSREPGSLQFLPHLPHPRHDARLFLTGHTRTQSNLWRPTAAPLELP